MRSGAGVSFAKYLYSSVICFAGNPRNFLSGQAYPLAGLNHSIIVHGQRFLCQYGVLWINADQSFGFS